jgi:flagellar hook-associated protein 3 FlgL
MRITNLMMVDNAIQNMADNLEKTSKLRTRVSTLKQFQNVSDDPARASASLSLRSSLRTLESYSDTASVTQNWMTASDNALNQLEEISIRASDLVLRGLNDSFSGSERAVAMGTEMKSLIDKAIEIGNTSVNGKFIFSGYQVNQKAFELVDSPTTIVDYLGNTVTPKVVNYLGDQGSMQRNLGPDQSVNLNVRGDQAILGFIQNLVLASNALTQNNVHNTNNPVTDPLTLQSSLTGLQSSLTTINQFRTSNGAKLRQVESASSFLETVKIETKSLLSQKEDTNLAEGIALLTNQQTTYQAVLEVSQRAISALSLFDFMK